MNEEVVDLSSSEDDEECNQRRANNLALRLLRDYYGPFLHDDDNLHRVFDSDGLTVIRMTYDMLRNHQNGSASQSVEQLAIREDALLKLMAYYNNKKQKIPKVEPLDLPPVRTPTVTRRVIPWRMPRRLRPPEIRNHDFGHRDNEREHQEHPPDVIPPKLSRWNQPAASSPTTALPPANAGQQAPLANSSVKVSQLVEAFFTQLLQRFPPPSTFTQAEATQPQQPNATPFINQNAVNMHSNLATPQGQNNLNQNRFNQPPPVIHNYPRNFNRPPPQLYGTCPSPYREHLSVKDAWNNRNNDRSNGRHSEPNQRNFHHNKRDPRNNSRFDKSRVVPSTSKHLSNRPSSYSSTSLKKTETEKTATKKTKIPCHSNSPKRPRDVYVKLHPETIPVSAPKPSDRYHEPSRDNEASGVDSGLDSPANLSSAGEIAMHSQEMPSVQLSSSAPTNLALNLPETTIVESPPQTPVPSALPVSKFGAKESLASSEDYTEEPVSVTETLQVHQQSIDAIIPSSAIKQEKGVEESTSSQEFHREELQIKVEIKEEPHDGETDSNADSGEDTEPEEDEEVPTGIDEVVDGSPSGSTEATDRIAPSDIQNHHEVLIVKQEPVDPDEERKKDLVEMEKLTLKCRKFEELRGNNPIALTPPTVNLWDQTVFPEVNNNFETPPSPLDNDENWERPLEEEDFEIQRLEPSQPPPEDEEDFVIQPLEPSQPPPDDDEEFEIQTLEPSQVGSPVKSSKRKAKSKPSACTKKRRN